MRKGLKRHVYPCIIMGRGWFSMDGVGRWVREDGGEAGRGSSYGAFWGRCAGLCGRMNHVIGEGNFSCCSTGYLNASLVIVVLEKQQFYE